MTQEPVKRPMQVLVPTAISGDGLGRETCGDHSLGLHGLLVETGSFSSPWIESVRADRHKMALSGLLKMRQPFQRPQSGLDHFFLAQCLTAYQEGMRKHGIAISQAVFKPRPIGRIIPTINLQEPLAQRFHQSASHRISSEPLTIFMDRQESEGPGSRAGEILGGRQSRLKKMSRRPTQPWLFRAPDDRPQAPQRTPMAIFRADLLLPTPVIGKKIAKSIGGRTKR